MAKYCEDLGKLHLMVGDSFGLEYLSPFIQLKDFVRYYFSRFLVNVQHSFDKFTQSEIEAFNKRYATQVAYLAGNSTIPLEGIIVPIPRGMIGSYKDTVAGLSNLLGKIQADQIVADLENITKMMIHRDVTASEHLAFTKRELDASKVTLGSLYGKTGLTHSVASHAFACSEDISVVNTRLLELVQRYYPLVFTLKDLVDGVELEHGKIQFEPREQKQIAQALMSVAYRLSIFAAVMDHVQETEHGLVGSMNVLLKRAQG